MSSAIHTAEHAVDRTRSSLADLGAQALKLVASLRAMETRGLDSMLHRMGLQRRAEAARPVVWFAAGALAAGALALLLAPESGKKLRGRIVHLWQSLSPPPSAASAEVPEATHTSNGVEELPH